MWRSTHGANLSDADLSYTDMGGTNLVCANLSGANLTWENLREANYNTETKWPAGFDRDAAEAVLVN